MNDFVRVNVGENTITIRPYQMGVVRNDGGYAVGYSVIQHQVLEIPNNWRNRRLVSKVMTSKNLKVVIKTLAHLLHISDKWKEKLEQQQS